MSFGAWGGVKGAYERGEIDLSHPVDSAAAPGRPARRRVLNTATFGGLAARR